MSQPLKRRGPEQGLPTPGPGSSARGSNSPLPSAGFLTQFGRVDLTWTPAGIRTLSFGDQATADVQGEPVCPWMVTIRQALDRATRQPAVPLDPEGTDFQRLVWENLRRIPPGRTLSYAALAVEIGRPTAARAVATACASNRIAWLIPCHRVVRGDGALGGYRWGLPLKRALLEAEGAFPSLLGFT